MTSPLQRGDLLHDEEWETERYYSNLESDCPDIYHGASRNLFSAVKYYIRQDATNVNKKNDNGDTPLIIASQNGYYDIVNLLINCGAELDSTDKSGETALHSASFEGHTTIVKLLIEKGANKNIQDNSKMTPLHSAVLSNEIEVIKILIENGADKNITDTKVTPYDLAKLLEHTQIVKYLKSH